MKNYVLQVQAGSLFLNVAQQAKDIAKELWVTVEFTFNGIKCLVDKDTNVYNLNRDYSNSWTMGWKTVGPYCPEKYDKDVQAEFERLTKINEEKATKEAEESRKKEATEKAVFDAKIEGVKLELKDAEGWNKSREANTDPYGKAALDYAEGWAKLMQVEISKGNKLIDVADKTSHELGFMGITGFMYGCAVNILSECWVHGEELRKWHNKEWGHEGDGVINPAVFTITKK